MDDCRTCYKIGTGIYCEPGDIIFYDGVKVNFSLGQPGPHKVDYCRGWRPKGYATNEE